VLKQTFARSATFFDQPEEAKMSVVWTTPEANRGYSAPGREKVSELMDSSGIGKERSVAPDLKESYEIGREGEPDHPNQWPKEHGATDGFKSHMIGFFDQCKKMHMEVMRAIAVGMGLDEGFFDKYVDVGDNTLRLLHYPAVDTKVFKVNPNAVRAGAHSVSWSQPFDPSTLNNREDGLTALLRTMVL
jgi:isopenicillin N synthase-like dioxygenase